MERSRQVVLSLRGVSKTYGAGDVEVRALRDVDLDVFDGEMLVVLGPSGSGKSTLLNLLGGMDRPTGGTIHFGTQDLSRASDRELTLFRRTQVGFVFQFFNLVPTLTALENVQVAAEIARHPLDPRDLLQQVGLAARAGNFPAQLSGGGAAACRHRARPGGKSAAAPVRRADRQPGFRDWPPGSRNSGAHPACARQDRRSAHSQRAGGTHRGSHGRDPRRRDGAARDEPRAHARGGPEVVSVLWRKMLRELWERKAPLRPGGSSPRC